MGLGTVQILVNLMKNLRCLVLDALMYLKSVKHVTGTYLVVVVIECAWMAYVLFNGPMGKHVPLKKLDTVHQVFAARAADLHVKNILLNQVSIAQHYLNLMNVLVIGAPLTRV